jgi:hypothetical protein
MRVVFITDMFAMDNDRVPSLHTEGSQIRSLSRPPCFLNVYKSGLIERSMLDLRHSFDGEHYRRGRLEVVKDASQKGVRRRRRAMAAPAQPVLCILDNVDPLAKLAAKR